MNGFQIGDIVRTQITGEEPGKYMITGFGEKNDEPVADLSSAKDTHDRRWQYLDRLELDVHGDLMTWGLCPNNPAFHIGECECHESEAPVIDTKDYTTHEHADFRAFRESLGLSRREVQEGADVSGSALWRIEQDPMKGTVEQRTAVWNFLVSFKAANPEGKPKKWSRTHGKPLTENEQMKALRSLYDAAQQNILSYNNLLVAVRTELDEQITKAIANKTSTKGLKAIKAIIEGTAGE